MGIYLAIFLLIVIVIALVLIRRLGKCEECVCKKVTLAPGPSSADDMDKIQMHDDFISPVILDKVARIVWDSGFRYGWKSDNKMEFGHWNMQMTSKNFPNGNRENIELFLPDEIVQMATIVKKTFGMEKANTVRCYSNAYTFGTEGYVHYDSKNDRDITVIIFLNKEWKENWFGETVFLDSKGEIVRSILPRYGRCIVFPGNIAHAGRSVSRICNVARTIMVFKFHIE